MSKESGLCLPEPQGIRQLLGMENDFTLEEEEIIRREDLDEGSLQELDRSIERCMQIRKRCMRIPGLDQERLRELDLELNGILERIKAFVQE